MNNPSQSGSSTLRIWNVCAAVAVLGLALSPLIQDSLHRAYQSDLPAGVPDDFPHYYLVGRLARLRPPENLLYYPPTDHTARSILDLRIDATTPYGRTSTWGGLPARAVRFPYLAPPFVALLMEPLSFLPWSTAYFVWQMLSVLMMVASVFFALRLFQVRLPPMVAVAIGFVVAILFHPFRLVLNYGNIDVVMLFLWVLGVFLLSRGRVRSSAFWLAFGTMIKLSPIYAIPLFALRRQWRWLAWYGVWSVALLIVSVWGVGWQNLGLWTRQVAPAMACGIKGWGNFSLAGLVLGFYQPQIRFANLAVPAGWCLVNKTLSGICYGAFLLWCWSKRRDSQGLIVELSLLPLVVLLVSPITWMQYYVLAALPLTFLWVRSRDFSMGGSRLHLILLTCSTLILGPPLPEYRIVRALGVPFAVFLWVAATTAILWVGMRMYGLCVPGGWEKPKDKIRPVQETAAV